MIWDLETLSLKGSETAEQIFLKIYENDCIGVKMVYVYWYVDLLQINVVSRKIYRRSYICFLILLIFPKV